MYWQGLSRVVFQTSNSGEEVKDISCHIVAQSCVAKLKLRHAACKQLLTRACACPLFAFVQSHGLPQPKLQRHTLRDCQLFIFIESYESYIVATAQPFGNQPKISSSVALQKSGCARLWKKILHDFGLCVLAIASASAPLDLHLLGC